MTPADTLDALHVLATAVLTEARAGGAPLTPELRDLAEVAATTAPAFPDAEELRVACLRAAAALLPLAGSTEAPGYRTHVRHMPASGVWWWVVAGPECHASGTRATEAEARAVVAGLLAVVSHG